MRLIRDIWSAFYLINHRSLLIDGSQILLSVWWNYDKSNHPQHLEGGYKNKILLNGLTDDELQDLRKRTTKKQLIWIEETEQYQTHMPIAEKNKYKDFVGVTCSCWVQGFEAQWNEKLL